MANKMPDEIFVQTDEDGDTVIWLEPPVSADVVKYIRADLCGADEPAEKILSTLKSGDKK